MPKPAELSERDWEIIRHVHRYRVSTERVLWGQFFAELGLDATRKAVSQLVTEGWLQKRPLAGQSKFLTLDTRGNCISGLTERARHRFSEQTLLEHFAVLFFCMRSGYERLTVADLRAMDPKFAKQPYLGRAYYVRQTNAGLNLSCCLADRGKSPRRLITRAHSVLASRYRSLRYTELIQDGRFSITILTAFPSMLEPLQLEIQERHQSRAAIFVEVVPEMAEFLAMRR